MSKAAPQIQKYMTFQPHAIEADATIAEAQALMSELNVRHLPVMVGEKVIGILSDRDIKSACALSGVDTDKTQVRYIDHENPYEVEPDAMLQDVVSEMAEHHYGCAIVVQNGKLVGIFTTVDACRALASLIEQRYH